MNMGRLTINDVVIDVPDSCLFPWLESQQSEILLQWLFLSVVILLSVSITGVVTQLIR